MIPAEGFGKSGVGRDLPFFGLPLLGSCFVGCCTSRLVRFVGFGIAFFGFSDLLFSLLVGGLACKELLGG